MAIDYFKNHLFIGQEWAFVLNGWSNDFAEQAARGFMAHEVAHSILKHTEREIAFGLKLQGISVESLNDVREFLYAAVESHFKEPPKTESAKRLYFRVLDFMNNYIGDSEEHKFYRMLKGLRRSIIQKIPEFYRNKEKEADLLTLRDPYLARGLRDYLTRVIEKCKKHPEFKCSDHSMDTVTHPSRVSRIEYITRALCVEYPKENSDICPGDARLRSRANSTCPVADLSYDYK